MIYRVVISFEIKASHVKSNVIEFIHAYKSLSSSALSGVTGDQKLYLHTSTEQC